jgi:periplasmic divalent cation tolerance protein
MADGAIVVLCMCPDEESAARIARELVDSAVAACVTRLPGARSTFLWEGRLVEEAEVLLIIKTVRAAYARLEQRLTALHPHKTPEILALPVLAGASGYLSWLQTMVPHETAD